MKQPKPKPPVKKYTASDSVAYERMMDRQFSDSKIISKGPSKKVNDAIVRSVNRQDSMIANPYYKQNYETAIKNFKKKVKSGGEKGTKPATAKTVTKSVSKKAAGSKPPVNVAKTQKKIDKLMSKPKSKTMGGNVVRTVRTMALRSKLEK